MNLKNNILNNITSEKIQPRPKWFFWIQDFAVVAISIFLMFLCGLSLSFLYYIFLNKALFVSGFFVIFLIALVFVLLSFVSSWLMFQEIKNMYKKTHLTTGLMLLALVSFFGFLNFAGGLHAYFDSSISRYIPVLGLEQFIKKSWSGQERTHLAGEVIGVQNQVVYLQDFQGKIHVLNLDLLGDLDRTKVVRYLRIKTIGFYKDDVFYVLQVSPWKMIGKHKKELFDGYELIEDNTDFSSR